MDNPLSIIPPKIRAWIYALLITANAVLTPLMAAGVIPSLYGAIVLSLLNVFGGAVALSNVPRREPLAVIPPVPPR